MGPLSPCARFLPEGADFQFFTASSLKVDKDSNPVSASGPDKAKLNPLFQYRP
jgi:hypothetical protein